MKKICWDNGFILIRLQEIIQTKGDKGLCSHMVSMGHNQLDVWSLTLSIYKFIS